MKTETKIKNPKEYLKLIKFSMEIHAK